MKRRETLATVSVLACMVTLPLVIGWYHTRCVLGAHPEGTKVITLYAVAEDGVWTQERVDGTNYWRKDFKPATLYLEAGERVVLRLESTDVHHRFYAPELGIGPIEVEPGHVVSTTFQAPQAGTYRYYCTAMCGHCHFYMQGSIVVSAPGQSPPHATDEVLACKHEWEKPPEEDMIAWGHYLYHAKGCIVCHGDQGRGGVTNPNYVKAEIPAHDTLADKLWLREKEHADLFVEMLKSQVDFDELEEQPDIPLFNLVLKQYEAARDLIKDGKHCAKAEKSGPEPPLQMLSWEALLSDRDIDAIIAYLLTLFEWDEDEE